MAKYAGMIGFAITRVSSPGVRVEEIEEHLYTGDLISNRRNSGSSGKINDNITMSMEISILADPFAYGNFQLIRYATYMGAKWRVSSVDVAYPRLILTLGDVYNE